MVHMVHSPETKKELKNLYKDMKNTRSKINPIKTGKELETTYTHNFKPHEVKMANKVLREKPNYVVCRSSISRFLKQKQNNKK